MKHSNQHVKFGLNYLWAELHFLRHCNFAAVDILPPVDGLQSHFKGFFDYDQVAVAGDIHLDV